MLPGYSKAYPITVTVFGVPQNPFPSDSIHEPDSAGLLAESVGRFEMLFRATRENQNFLFRLRRDQLARLGQAIDQLLKETLPDTH